MSTVERVEHFIRGAFPLASGVSRNGSLVMSGTLDSMDVAKLEVWIEREFGVALGACDLTVNTADTIEDVAAFIDRRVAAR